MAENIAGTYATLAGVEIVNDARTYAYLQNGLGPSSINVYGDCGCPSLIDFLNCPDVTGGVGYVSPAADNAPWYSMDYPESANFLGFVVDEFEGMSSPFKRNAVEVVGNGAVLSRSRLASRSLTWRGFLFGATCCSVQYGLRWMTKTISRFDASCRDCFGDDMELLVCCPEFTEPVTGTSSPFRLLKGVALLEGPTILSERKTCTSGCAYGCGGSCILEVEFKFVATQPYLYNDPIPVFDCVPFTDATLDPVTDPDEPCPPFDCIDVMLQDLEESLLLPCTTPDLPPTSTYINSCFTDLEEDLGPTLYLTVPRTLWSDLDEVVPVITITNGNGFFNQGVKIGFYSSLDGNPCGDLTLNPPGCDALCDDLLIGPIPPNSSFYIDGRTRRMSIICPDGTAFAGEKITNGPWSWPAFSQLGFCMIVQFVNGTIDPILQAPPDNCVSLSLVPRSY